MGGSIVPGTSCQGADNFLDIGQSGTNRPRDLFLARNLVLSTSSRILGDFDNPTIASRTLFQTSTTNSHTYVGVIPQRDKDLQGAILGVYNSSSAANMSYCHFGIDGTSAYISSYRSGTGGMLPLTISVGWFRADADRDDWHRELHGVPHLT